MMFLFYLVMVLFVIVCFLLMMLVLIQKGRGGGLASAFGGASGHTPFGSKTGDVLTWTTSILFGIFILLAILLNLISNKIQTTPEGKVPGAKQSMVIPVDAEQRHLSSFFA